MQAVFDKGLDALSPEEVMQLICHLGLDYLVASFRENGVRYGYAIFWFVRVDLSHSRMLTLDQRVRPARHGPGRTAGNITQPHSG